MSYVLKMGSLSVPTLMRLSKGRGSGNGRRKSRITLKNKGGKGAWFTIRAAIIHVILSEAKNL